MEKRTISTELIEEDYKIENSLRPKFLTDYIGQRKVKENLEIYIKAAKARKEALDHVYCMVLRDLEKPRWPGSLPMKWM